MLSLYHSRTTARNPSFLSLRTRGFYISRIRRDFVAPPDPVSHMRPVIYDDPPSKLSPPYLRHPYSLSEFKNGNANDLGNYELQFHLMRRQLDSLHENFWLDSNARFYAAKGAVLGGLPHSASSRDKEKALSTFHRQWVMQEKDWTDSYTTEWRARNLQLIFLATRLQTHRLRTFLASFFKTPYS